MNTNKRDFDLGMGIKLARIKAGMSQGEMAKKAGLSRQYMSLLETNRSDPTISALERLAAACDVSISDFFVEA